MKQIFFLLTILFIVNSSFAQMPDKFMKAMEQKVIAADTTRSVDGLNDLANAFERIGDAEKNQWLAYYYASYCKVTAGLMMNSGSMMGGNADKTDPVANKAEELLNKAEALEKNNSEIFLIKKMIATLRMMADPMNRYQTYGPAAAEALATAKKINPENPRAYLLEGQDKFFTPEQFGGSKTEAKVLFETAMKKYEVTKPETSIHPFWGLATTKYFYSQCQ